MDAPDAIGTTGRRFRDTVLSLGGSKHPMEVFTAFRGREPVAQPWWEITAGTFADDPAFEEAMELGRQYRKSS